MPEVLVGYARTSTAEQEAGLAAQERDLRAAGCAKIFAERVSSVAQRPQLAAALDYVREGDVLVVAKPDRLARSVADLLGIVASLEKKGVALRILSMGGTEVDTRSPTGRLMLTMLGAIGQFERDLMLERQREGIQKAKAEKKYKGRAPTAMRQGAEVRKLRDAGVKPGEIAKRLGMARSSVYRVLDAGASREKAGRTEKTEARTTPIVFLDPNTGMPTGKTATAEISSETRVIRVIAYPAKTGGE
jgi:DNA invertase Pin-like site-specific DNA recombinase